MKHEYSEVIDFQYDRNLLYKTVKEIVEENNLFNKAVPISAFKNLQKIKILSALNLKFRDTLFDIYMNSVTVACLQPKQRSAIHVDRDVDNTFTTKALNVPVTECSNVVMNWYKVKPGGVIKTIRSARGWEIPGLSLDQSVIIHSQTANKPFLVNPSTFHDIINNGDKPELIISIRTGNENWSG